jgi:hypothetical protein
MPDSDQNAPDPRIREAGAGSEWLGSDPRNDSPPAPPLPEPEEEFDSIRRNRSAPREEDIRHLHWLGISYFVVAGLMALCGTLPIVHLVLGISMLSGGMKGSGPPPPPALGAMFVGFASAMMLLMWGLAVCMLITGLNLRRRRGYVFCLVTAGLACLNQPFGVVLGVFTFIILLRPSVKTLFGRPS